MLTQYIISHELKQCQPTKISQHIAEQIDLTQYGLCDVQFFITDFAVVKTFRLIDGGMSRYMNNYGALETNSHVQQGPSLVN